MVEMEECLSLNRLLVFEREDLKRPAVVILLKLKLTMDELSEL